MPPHTQHFKQGSFHYFHLSSNFLHTSYVLDAKEGV